MSPWKRAGGFFLAIISVLSLLLGVAGIAGVWIVRKPVSDSLVAFVGLAGSTLAVTDQALAVVDEGLIQAEEAVARARDATTSLATSLESTTPAVQAIATFVGDGLSASLKAAGTTVGAAQRSAELVDGALSLLNQIPLVNIDYNPEVPLAQALGDINTSLEDVPAQLESIGTQLSASAANLPTLSSSMGELGDSIAGVTGTVTSARQSVQDYRDLVARYQGIVLAIQRLIPWLTAIVPLLVTLLFFWLGVVQVATLRKALEWAGLRQPEPAYGTPTVVIPERKIS
jgi:hypothetical protein